MLNKLRRISIHLFALPFDCLSCRNKCINLLNYNSVWRSEPKRKHFDSHLVRWLVKGNKEMAKGTTTKARRRNKNKKNKNKIQDQQTNGGEQKKKIIRKKGQCRHWATAGQRRHTYINKFALRRGEVRVIIKTEQTDKQGREGHQGAGHRPRGCGRQIFR